MKSTILTDISTQDEDFDTATDLATPGRLLVAIKRSGAYKARGVKQGFKEDTKLADGPDFNYYAYVAKLNSIRMSTFRLDRRERKIGVKDVSTAFLQANKYPDGTHKYINFEDPPTKEWRYFKQSGPIYGEKSAQRRWEDTMAPWYESTGFVGGKNEPSVGTGVASGDANPALSASSCTAPIADLSCCISLTSESIKG